MTALIIGLSILLLVIVILQISKLTDMYGRIRGEEEVEERMNRNQARVMLLFMIGLLVFCILSAYWWKNYMMGYGPHKAASAHGASLDSLFNVTLLFTGIVFVLTHIALFYFAWKYKKVKGSKATHWSHNNTLEIVWSAIPAVVMTYLVIKGLLAWNTVMADIKPGEDHMEIEATGYQFAWHLRYPGADGIIGARDYKKITADNPLGQDWTDPHNFDDFHPDELWLPVGKKVRVRIIAETFCIIFISLISGSRWMPYRAFRLTLSLHLRKQRSNTAMNCVIIRNTMYPRIQTTLKAKCFGKSSTTSWPALNCVVNPTTV